MQPCTTVSSVSELKNLSLGKQIIIYLSLVEFFNVAYNFCETTYTYAFKIWAWQWKSYILNIYLLERVLRQH